ncbi:MAG: hypothetical protein Q8O72_08365 [Bacteroidales bacterium]|nr:hypothetical protein [Bacteroidales bacterium]
MKRVVFVIVLILWCISGYNQCVYCDGQGSVNSSEFASNLGINNNADGRASIAGGFGARAIGAYSIALGRDVLAYVPSSFVMGSFLEAYGSNAFVIGEGYDNNNRLVNRIPSSLVFGFKSTAPTLFIKGADITIQKNRTGQVGIGDVKEFLAKLHIKSDAGELADIFLQSTDWDNKSAANIYIGTLGHGVSSSATEGLVFNSEKNYLFKRGNVGFGLDPEELPAARLHIKAEKEGIASVFIEPFEWSDGTSTGGDPLETKGALALSTSGAYLLLGNQLHGIGAKRNTGLIFNTESFYVFNDGFLKIGKDARVGSVLACTDGVGTAKWIDPASYALWSVNEVKDIYRMSKVGILNEKPETELDVRGTVRMTGFMLANPEAQIGRVLSCSAITGEASWVDPAVMSPWTILETGDIYFTGGNSKVGIGTINNTHYALAVLGSIITDEVMVRDPVAWFDHVFSPKYNLMPLNELSLFINQNQHLPDVPSEKEVMENGYGLAEMNGILLKKVEELTLYILEQQKVLEKQQCELNEIKDQFKK